MATCIHCKRTIPENSSYCNYCGGYQGTKTKTAIQESKAPKSASRFIYIILLILFVVVVGGVLIAWALGSIPEEYKGKPELIIGFGAVVLVIGLVAWFVSSRFNVEFRGKLAGCYIFPILGLIIVVTGLFLFLIQLFGLGKNPQTVANANPTQAPYHSPTNTIYSTRPTATKTQVVLSPTRTKETARCTSFNLVTLADVGKKMCVTGFVYSAASDNVAFYVKFGSSPLQFFFVSYAYTYPTVKKGLCIEGTGIVRQIGNTPVIVLDESSNHNLQACP